MNKYVILSLADTVFTSLFESTTYPIIRRYCDRYDIDFMVYGEDEHYHNFLSHSDRQSVEAKSCLFKWGYNAKFKKPLELLEKGYEKILLMDGDILILDLIAPNIFEYIDEPYDIMAVDEKSGWSKNLIKWALPELNKQFSPELKLEDYDDKYYNFGFTLIKNTENSKKIFSTKPTVDYSFKDEVQAYFNYLIFHNMKYSSLDMKSFKKPISNMIRYNEAFDLLDELYFIHYFGLTNCYVKRNEIISEHINKFQELGYCSK